MANKVIEQFYANDNWVAPAGVTQVTIRTQATPGLIGCDVSATAIDVFENAWAWGTNLNGQLGLGDVTNRSSPIVVIGGLNFKNLYQNNAQNGNSNWIYGIDTHGKAYAWGVNVSGQLGVGDVTVRSSPVAVLGGLTFQKLSIVNFGGTTGSVCGLTSGGKAYSWGRNASGGLGVGDVTARSSPVAVLGGLLFQDVVCSSGGDSFYGLTPDGVLYAWGQNGNGHLGVGDVIPRSSPVAVLGGLVFKRIFAGPVNMAMGLTTTGLLYAWGLNLSGQLGVGDSTPRSSPVLVLGGLTFNRLFGTNSNGSGGSWLGLTATGKAYAWGQNFGGTLGVGDVTNRSSPVAVLGGLFFENVFTCTDAFYALNSAGTAYAWGRNPNGQLGVGDVNDRSSPVAILGGLVFSKLDTSPETGNSTGQTSMLGMTTNGTLYAWGVNGNGQLGVGDILPRSSPVAVLGAIAFKSQGQLANTTVIVIPGTSYPIKIGAFNTSFGGMSIGSGGVTKMVLEYFQ